MLTERNPGGIIGAWAGGLLLTGSMYWFSLRFPAFEDLLYPLYWIVGIILVVFTVKWLRRRRAQDRRGDDRRKSSRRDE